MSFLIRKINRAKWFQVDVLNDDDVSADAITNCLKTTKNTLSVWHITTEDEIENAILALVSRQDHLETIDVIMLKESSINNYNIKIDATPGDTPIESLVQSHRDLADLTFSKIEYLKNHIVDRIRKDKLLRFTVGSLKKLLKTAIEDDKLMIEDLRGSVQKKIYSNPQ